MDTAARILVVDDDAMMRLLVQTALAAGGFDVHVAGDGAAGLSLFRSAPFDLVMLDVDMPMMSGHDLCAQIRREAGTQIPIVMVTGLDDVDSIERAYHLGATDFISKPINPALIAHRIRYLLRSSRALSDLSAAHAQNAAVLRAIPDALFEIGVDGRVLTSHVPAERPFPEYGSAVGRTIDEAWPAEAAVALKAAMAAASNSGRSAGSQYRCASPNENRWFELSVARKIDDDRVTSFIALARDISDRKAAEQRIAQLAYFDSLTGLPNRHAFLERVDREIARARVNGTKLAVLYMDLDGFKSVNDTMGHSAGDLILQWAAERLREGLRPSDLVARHLGRSDEVDLARLGGDEFTALVLGIAEVDDALRIAMRIGQLMRRPFQLDGRDVTLTTSCGVAVFPDDGGDAATLLKHADTAMYHAKDCGRDNTQPYRVALTELALKRMELDAALRRALDQGEFTLVYQPQVDTMSGRVASAEALVRWRHPELGIVAPAEFISVAEENGLIDQIGHWVLKQACSEAAQWAQAGHAAVVAVNLSPRQFTNRKLVEQATQVLEETGLDPRLLELEITESALMENLAETIDSLQALRRLGVRIALDDFGTGFSSLGCLIKMPINNLKIDRCFVTGMLESAESRAIVRAVVAMARSLELRVTAEGVETLDHARMLTRMGCDTLQGYVFGRPMPASELEANIGRCWDIALDVGTIDASRGVA